MGHTQSDIDDIVNQIVNEFTGRSIAYFGSYPNECSVPVAYYVDKIRGTSPVPGMANDRADGWGTNFPYALSSDFNHESFQRGRSYPRGTILMWNSPHIAIVLHSDGSNNVQVFEQNADPDGSVCGSKNRVVNNQYHQCTYALVPIISEPPPPPPPPVVIEPPAPVIPPKPIEVEVVSPPPYISPSGALPVPTPNNKYYVRKTILAFLAYTKAANHEDASTTISPGNYFIYRETAGMLNLTKTQGIVGYWINPADNVPDPPPQQVTTTSVTINPNSFKASYSSFSDDRTPIKYVFLEDYLITDLGGQRPPINAKKYSEINIYGTFVKDDTIYYRPKLQADVLFQYYYGIPDIDPLTGTYIIEQYDEVYNLKTTTADHMATKTITSLDRLVIFGETIGKWWDIIIKKKK